MQGLLADVNVEGHLEVLQRVLEALGLWVVLVEVDVRFLTFADVQLPRDLDDRSLWNRCQAEGWVLFTENRNEDDADSLEATLRDSWKPNHLPVLTLANKRRFLADRAYAERVGTDVAELLFGITQEQYRDQPRIYVPLSARAAL